MTTLLRPASGFRAGCGRTSYRPGSGMSPWTLIFRACRSPAKWGFMRASAFPCWRGKRSSRYWNSSLDAPLQLDVGLAERVFGALALPLCAWCKKIRDDKGYWSDVGEYLKKNSEAKVSHGVCPECCA